MFSLRMYEISQPSMKTTQEDLISIETPIK